MTPAQQLRDLLAQPNLEIMPGCYDALSAKLVADAGYKVTFMSGFAVSAARLGLPDTGLISFTEMLDSLRNCCAAAAKIPLIGDGDTGYGNALNVQRTVVEYARAGAAAVMIEDQVSPKKCGHTRGKQVISRDEARMKIRAAVEARAGADILIMARTDARAVHGFDEALARCRDFEAEGADIIFLEAPETEDEMRRFCAAMNKPCMANMVPGGKTPILPRGAIAGDRLQARALSGDAAVVGDRRDAGDARGAAAGLQGAAAAERVLRRSAGRRRFSRLLGAGDALPGQGLKGPTRTSLDLRGTAHAGDHRGPQHVFARGALVGRGPPHRIERFLPRLGIALADDLLIAVGLLLHRLDRDRAPLPVVAVQQPVVGARPDLLRACRPG